MAIPYGEFEKDLVALVTERVEQAIKSVVQICDGPDQAFLITVSAHGVAAAWMAGAFAKRDGMPSVDPLELARIVLNRQIEVRDEEPPHG